MIGKAVDGRVAESYIPWKCPFSSEPRNLEVSVSLEMGSDPEDDIVLKADANDIHSWRWSASNQINLSSRLCWIFLVPQVVFYVPRVILVQ